MDVMLSDNIKRLLCRAGFVMLCAIPTMMVLKSVLFPRSDLEWSANFQQQFGVINHIDDVQVMSPQRTDFAGLRIGADQFENRLQIDVASLQTLAEGRTLFIENAVGSVPAFWDSIARITETIAWSGKSDRPIRLHFDSMTFVENDAPGAQVCVWEDLKIDVTHKGQLLSASFVCDQKTKAWTDGECRVQVERRAEADGETWSVVGIGYRIPAWILKHTVPAAAALNVTAELADARATLTSNRGQWSGEIHSGQIRSIELQQVIAERFGSFVSGNADVNIERGKLTNNRIEFLQGRLHCPSGNIGTDLLHACTRSFGMVLVEPFGTRENERYTDLSFGFVVNQETISIYTMVNGAVLNDENGNGMMVAQRGREHPVSSLVSLLSRDKINPRAAALANHLFLAPPSVDRGFEIEAIERTARQGDANVK